MLKNIAEFFTEGTNFTQVKKGRKQKPDLVYKSDKVRNKEYPNGCPTIGFGHTGRVDDKIIVNGKTKITEAKAYEILEQDILDAKLDAIVYIGKRHSTVRLNQSRQGLLM